MSHHSELIDTTEMYLRTVYELEEEGVVPCAPGSPSGSGRAVPR